MIVGEVTDVVLMPDHSGIDLKVRMPPETASLARAGSRFWVVRPTASFATGLGGLDTLVGDQYVAVRPGDGPAATAFVGDDEPAPPQPPKDSLRLVFRTKEKTFSLRPGAPITCAGMPIGQVCTVDLTADGKGVVSEAYVEGKWAGLVAEGAKFRTRNAFSAKGMMLKVDVQGIAGGVELSVPDRPGPAAKREPPPTFDLLPGD